MGIAAYALSPIDLIPDFIPVLGLLDEAILLPLAILLAIRLIPAPLLAEFRATAAGRGAAGQPGGGGLRGAVWLLAAAGLFWWRRGGRHFSPLDACVNPTFFVGCRARRMPDPRNR